jgi:hypothetical protein
MIGPWLYAGSRWVAPRELKDLRWPENGNVAEPVDAGSYVAIYWIEKGQHQAHIDWAITQVFDLYANGGASPNATTSTPSCSITSARCTATPIRCP